MGLWIGAALAGAMMMAVPAAAATFSGNFANIATGVIPFTMIVFFGMAGGALRRQRRLRGTEGGAATA